MNSEVLSTANAWMEKEPSLTWPSPPPSPDGQSQARLELFQKLGYSAAQVQGVLQKFGPGMDTDKLLEKLVTVAPEQAVRVNVPQWDVRAERPALQVPVTRGSPGPEESPDEEDQLRPIVIDGSNVAMSHGNKEVFSCLGIKLAVNFFLERGHKSITVFVPKWRSEKPRPDVPISDQHILCDLEEQRLLVYTPSKRVGGKRVVCHDDRYIVRLAFETDGLIVSNDLYRDLQRENPEWKRFIEERLIMYSFVNDKFMPPDDPMGRHGPSLDDLRHKCPVVQRKQPCPYGRKCTFGIKCRFLHPERPKQSNQTLADELRSRCSLPHAPGHSLSLVKDMAEKLTLGPPLKKDHHSDPPSRHGKKGCSKKERKSRHASLEHGPAAGGEPPEQQLDSGLGSIDAQPYDAAYGSGLYSQPQSAPCGGRLPAHHPGFPPQQGAARSDLSLCYNAPPYPGYGSYGSYGAFSHPPDFPPAMHRPPQPMYWSDPYMGSPRGARGPPEEPPQWERGPASAGQAKDPREGVRKKLMAIFSARLVDAAMNMNPQVLDPQRLAAEILRLQSQGL